MSPRRYCQICCRYQPIWTNCRGCVGRVSLVCVGRRCWTRTLIMLEKETNASFLLCTSCRANKSRRSGHQDDEPRPTTQPNSKTTELVVIIDLLQLYIDRKLSLVLDSVIFVPKGRADAIARVSVNAPSTSTSTQEPITTTREVQLDQVLSNSGGSGELKPSTGKENAESVNVSTDVKPLITAEDKSATTSEAKSSTTTKNKNTNVAQAPKSVMTFTAGKTANGVLVPTPVGTSASKETKASPAKSKSTITPGRTTSAESTSAAETSTDAQKFAEVSTGAKASTNGETSTGAIPKVLTKTQKKKLRKRNQKIPPQIATSLPQKSGPEAAKAVHDSKPETSKTKDALDLKLEEVKWNGAEFIKSFLEEVKLKDTELIKSFLSAEFIFLQSPTTSPEAAGKKQKPKKKDKTIEDEAPDSLALIKSMANLALD